MLVCIFELVDGAHDTSTVVEIFIAWLKSFCLGGNTLNRVEIESKINYVISGTPY